MTHTIHTFQGSVCVCVCVCVCVLEGDTPNHIGCYLPGIPISLQDLGIKFAVAVVFPVKYIRVKYKNHTNF